jgi:LEA14-like dessication related protein
MPTHQSRPCLALPVLILGALAGCGLAGFAEGFEFPTITLSDTKVVEYSTDTLEATLGLEIRNPNPYALPVRQVRYRLRVEGSEVAAGTHGVETDVAAYGSARVEVPLEIALSDLEDGTSDAMRTGEIPFELEAWISVGPLLSSRTVYIAGSSALCVDLPLGLASWSAFPPCNWQPARQTTGTPERWRARPLPLRSAGTGTPAGFTLASSAHPAGTNR